MSLPKVTFNLTYGKGVTELQNLTNLHLSSFAESHQMQQKNVDVSPKCPGGKCQGVYVLGVGVLGVSVLGVSVQGVSVPGVLCPRGKCPGVHVRGDSVLEPLQYLKILIINKVN